MDYLAVPVTAKLGALAAGERLYVGAQTQDRMFRGDGGIGGSNYHHAEMRAGNGADTPVAYLRTGREIAIHRISAEALATAVGREASFARLKPLLERGGTGKTHVGWWFEQLLLHAYEGQWRWNTKPVERRARDLIASLLG